MNSRVLVIALGGLVVLGGAGAALYFISRPAAEPRAVTTPAPPPAGGTAKPAEPKGDVAKPLTTGNASGGSGVPAVPTAPVAPAAPDPKLGTLIIESDVPDTSVFIDRVYLGTAPVTAKDLAPGQHRLNMSATGYEGVSETIDVEPGTRTISMKFKEIKLDEQIDVTHKHGIGSCSGTLRASPQRLTYQTTNAGDAFAAPLTNLEIFQMDFVQKTLRVKVRDGKSYNFTVQGDATGLYQFHQTVEKVRQRLLAGRRP